MVWHYNQTPEEYEISNYNEEKEYNGETFATWPEDSSYPDFFLFGDPHINYYEGSAEFDDLKLYIPE